MVILHETHIDLARFHQNLLKQELANLIPGAHRPRMVIAVLVNVNQNQPLINRTSTCLKVKSYILEILFVDDSLPLLAVVQRALRRILELVDVEISKAFVRLLDLKPRVMVI